MKTKITIPLIILFVGLLNHSLAQDKDRARTAESVVWFGIDFTVSKFTFVTDDPSVIVYKYLKAINMVVLTEPEKYNINMYFHKSDVIKNIDLANEYNSKIDPAKLVINSDHRINPEDIKSVIKKYSTEDKSGMGLIFVAENLNKIDQTGSYYVVFFDIATKEIIDSRRMEGKAGGFGFRNYWAGSVYNVMKEWM
ncbi:MAG: hypothetical protein JW973_17280 [Bacteroidales bacterium]|nr:hypothetical protein [Bacteroidales bacterium]